MSFLVTRSVPVGDVTRGAITDWGGRFVRRDRTAAEIRQLSFGHEFVWNMGNLHLDLPDLGIPFFNPASEVVTKLATPTATREFIGDLMPPQSEDSEFVWSKRPGRGGRGKQKIRREEANLDELDYWEDHIEGQEYRIVTVGNKRVQQYERTGDNANRSYRWISMRELPRSAKLVVKSASSRLLPTSIIAWDVVHASSRNSPNESLARESLARDSRRAPGQSELETNRPCFVLEGNTSPGLNEFTVKRIIEQIRGGNYA